MGDLQVAKGEQNGHSLVRCIRIHYRPFSVPHKISGNQNTFPASLLLLIINERKEDYGHIGKKNVRLKCQDSGFDFSY